MVKKNVLTPVLAGVLGVTVAGSGVLYALDKKDSKVTTDDEKDNKGGVKTSINDTAFGRVKEKVEATAEKVEKAINGELDFAYNAKAEIDFGPALTKEFGVDLKTIALEAKTRQKAGMSEADISAAYDSKTLATLNFVADNTNKKIYIKVPELSSAYLTATEDELMKLLDDSGDILNNLNPGSLNAMSISGMQNQNLDQLKEIINKIDMDALLKDLEEYVDVVKDKLPEGKDNGKEEGDINGNSYSYTVKTVDITGQVVVDIVNAVADKAQNDQTLKDIFEQSGMGSSYDQMISSLKSSLTQSTSQNLDKTLFTIDVFYDGNDTPTGFKLDLDGKGTLKLVGINSTDTLGLDLTANMNGQDVITAKGAFKNTNDSISGDFDLAVNQGGDVATSLNVSVKDLKEQGDLFSGSIKAKFTQNKGSVGVSLDSASTADKLDITFKLDKDDENGLTVKLTGEKSDASDITVPSGDAFTLSEEGLKNYLKTIDKDAFMDKIKSALGDELWNKFNSGNDDWDDDDWDE